MKTKNIYEVTLVKLKYTKKIIEKQRFNIGVTTFSTFMKNIRLT